MNSFLKGGGKIPVALSQTTKNIEFSLNKLQYFNKTTYVDPNINQALHHMLFNIRADLIMNMFPDFKQNLSNIGLLNNFIYSYIATSKFNTLFFDTGLMKYQLLDNKLIGDKKLLGYVGAQYLSRLVLIMDEVNWVNLNQHSQINIFLEKEENVFVGMFKNLEEGVKNLISLNILPNEVNNLDDAILLYKTLIEAQYQMSLGYKHQFENIGFKANILMSQDICQILYNVDVLSVGPNKFKVTMDCVAVNNDILKTVALEESKYKSSLELIEILKNTTNQELLDLNLKNVIKKDNFLKINLNKK